MVEKTNSINQPRYGCSLGSLYTATAIPRVIPITHCGPGCADKQFSSTAFYNGFQGAGYGGGAVSPSDNLSEKEVVFGGAERLNELINASLKVMDADLFVVLTGCIADLVGDDVGSVVSKFQEKGIPIVYAETGGFKGNNYTGHELVVKAIIDQYVGDYYGPKENGLVNVWSLVPFVDTFWRGDLEEVKRILEGIGLKVNILFGHESGGINEWKSIPKADFNLVLSPWIGLDIAKHLETKYNQPYLHIPTIPIGAQETSSFLRKVGEYAKLDKNKVESFIKKEENYYYYYLEHFSDFYSEYWWGLPAQFGVVSNSAYNLALTKFLVNQLGLIPGKQIVTENTPDEYKDYIIEQYTHIADDVSTTVDFIEDGYTIGQELLKTDFGHKPPLLFASTWDRDIAKQLNAGIVEISFPASYEVVINRANVGYRGALSLLEKIYTTAISKSA